MDHNENHLLWYTYDGTVIRCVGSPKTGQFQSPVGVAIQTSTSHIFVSEFSASRVQVLDAEGKFLRHLGTGPGMGETQLSWPYDICFNHKGNILIADSNNSRIVEWTPNGDFVQQIILDGTPTGICVDPHGQYLITMNSEPTIKYYSPAGQYLKSLHICPTLKGSSEVFSCTVDCDGNGLFPPFLLGTKTHPHLVLSD